MIESNKGDFEKWPLREDGQRKDLNEMSVSEKQMILAQLTERREPELIMLAMAEKAHASELGIRTDH